jgi:hypothetical protein
VNPLRLSQHGKSPPQVHLSQARGLLKRGGRGAGPREGANLVFIADVLSLTEEVVDQPHLHGKMIGVPLGLCAREICGHDSQE